MRDDGKRNLIGVLVDVVDYEGATSRVIAAATDGRPLSATALAVHGLVTGARDPDLRYRLNHFDLVVPDGQPVRWGLNLLYRTHLSDRVYGPRLMLEVCAAAADAGLPVYLFGSTEDVLGPLRQSLLTRYPKLVIAGTEPSKFRRTTEEEQRELAARIPDSGARIVFVGLGCPRQEVFVHECRDLLPGPAIAVGAAFDYHAGRLPTPPPQLQRAGLEWAFRLSREPRRLWRRYATTNPAYLAMLAAQASRMWRPDPSTDHPPEPLRYG